MPEARFELHEWEKLEREAREVEEAIEALREPPESRKKRLKKERQQETYGALLLLDLIEGREPRPEHVKWLEKDWKPDFRWAESGGSWNHWPILTAARLWLRAEPIVIALILDYLRAQLGEVKAPAHPTLEFFGGTEQGSNTYEGWRWGFVLAARLLALRFPDHPAAQETLRLTARYSEVQTALLALGASPGPTKYGFVVSPDASLALHQTSPGGQSTVVHANRRGRLWWEGPSLPVSGNRSTPAHVGQDDRAPLYGFYRGGEPFKYADNRFGWPNVVLQRVLFASGTERPSWGNAMWGSVYASLSDIRLLVPHHFATWRAEGIRANWIERQSNGNTTSILGHVMYEQEQRAVYLFPWSGRLRKGLGEAACEMTAQAGVVRVLAAESRFGEVSCELPERDPDSHVVMGPEGLEVLR